MSNCNFSSGCVKGAPTPYAASKLKGEIYLQKLASKQGLRYVTVRLGTIFGTSPGMRFHTAVNKFCWQATMQQPITVWRTAMRQKRPYLDLSDASRAMQFILQKRLFTNSVYNVVTVNAAVADILNQIKKHIPSVKTKMINDKAMNTLSYSVRCDRLQQAGFQFRGSLEKSIKETIHLLKLPT